ncbi:MAG: hypothetical protein JW934_06735 [Anaerolineae bacterium]|nr:hypothetical protein [Anaerolineae bacterium]
MYDPSDYLPDFKLDPPPPPPRRKPGAQPGNANAYKHGFYSRKWKLRDRKGLENIETVDLANEIALLRVYIRRLIESAQDGVSDLNDLQVIRALSLASTALNRLVRTQNNIVPPDSELQQILNQAIDEVTEEFGLKERFGGGK